MKRPASVIGSHTGLRAMLSAGMLAVLLVLAGAGAEAGAMWVVDDGGGADFTSMQGA